MGSRRALKVATVACGLVALGILFVTVSPEPIDRPYHALVVWIVSRVAALPGLQWFDRSSLERLGNTLMFVPIGVLLELILGIRRWWLILLVAAAFSSGVELAQLAWLPDRTPSLVDVLTNTVGAACGVAVSAVIALAVRRVRRRSSGRRARE